MDKFCRFERMKNEKEVERKKEQSSRLMDGLGS